jgi:hypothetical protein
MTQNPIIRRLALAFVAAAACAVPAAYAQGQQDQQGQRGRIWVGNGGFYRMPPKWAKESDFTGAFIYCRGYYESDRYEDGGMGWWTDYPGADNNFSVRLGELTKVNVPLDANREPNYVVVALTDPLIFRCPMVYMEDVGTASFSDEEVAGLRAYLLKGGFLTVDDFWGSRAWKQWAEEIGRVLPPGEFPIIDIPPSHPIMRSLYDVKTVEQVSSIQFWSRSGSVSERGSDSAQVHFRGIQDSRGRLMVLMAHNTDIPDTWEREGENQEYFDRFSPAGYAIGVNTVLYALTH